ncbi:LADA_0F06832g1_1 [Lachancea dasiensis]|uniref:LADA_0F06832g1_1 n=1 Tax=Lachancea dasiensis TaxID=1072105 RepID=A0A1G4JK35_9SACH|nr:LADA_0F06832g1_1 [Lachancea dasiensis]
MVSFDATAYDEALHFGGPSWQDVKHRDQLNSVQSWSSQSTQDTASEDSLWTLDLLEAEPLPDRPCAPVMRTPPITAYSGHTSRPAFIKANSFSEGVREFEDVSRLFTPDLVTAQSQLYMPTTIAGFNSRFNRHGSQQPLRPFHPQAYATRQRMGGWQPLSHHAHLPYTASDPFAATSDYHLSTRRDANVGGQRCSFDLEYHGYCDYEAQGGHARQPEQDSTELAHYHSHQQEAAFAVASDDPRVYIPCQVTSRSSVPEIPRLNYFEDFQPASRLDSEGRLSSSGMNSSPPRPSSNVSEPYFPGITATKPEGEPGSTLSSVESEDDLEERFYQSFNTPAQRSPTSKHESVYEQMINDLPLMEALSKRVKRGYYRCAHCPKMFSNVLDYARHIDDFEIQRDYKCPFVLCPWKILGLPRRPELRRHCAIQHKLEIPPELKHSLKLGESDFPIMGCPSPFCEKKFFRRDSYVRHVAMVHDKVDSRFNRRLAKVLGECPHSCGTPEHTTYVLAEMVSTKRK